MADVRAARHGPHLALHTGWGAHYYGNTPAVAPTLMIRGRRSGTHVNGPPGVRAHSIEPYGP
ncbi:hypothetical protein SGFS_003990 [Streptomyces graminofaciens]|jgi:hypothetical protein|uniref:Uncharacterized protein n=1 Tax=Streptomyces graminofaciens TaxID=68212 RepID=A0ABN5V750_9ACTN|nr:hypothetical protein SGFS_003990 [Streptomyces graminofaciens]